MLYNIPFVIIGLVKYKSGKYAGQEKLSDLVRATVTVDESKPNQVLEVLNAIAKNPNF